MVRILKEKLEEYGKENPRMLKEVFPNLMMVTDLGELLDQIAIQLPWDYKNRQKVLECVLLEERYETVMRNLLTEIEITRVKREIQGRVKENVDKNQKDYILREQLKVIREELGEDNPLSDADEYEKQLKALKADKETKDKIHREIERFKPCRAEARRPTYSACIWRQCWIFRGKRCRRTITTYRMPRRF